MTDSALNAFALGWATTSAAGATLDVWFPMPQRVSDAAAAALRETLPVGSSTITPAQAGTLLERLDAVAPEGRDAAAAQRALLEHDRPLIACWLPTDAPIEDTACAYLKLHLLSHRLCLPNSLDLANIFSHLPNLAWTNEGPVALTELTARQLAARAAGRILDVHAVDKFPKLTNYLHPSGVRIADSARVRLGAYLGEGSTVMHEGFVNFNAGALGPNMLEGRVSQGVVVGAHTDLGGSSSTMGTLSGGGDIRITIGEHCLIGANAGTGIPLGDRCTIEAGLYITAATPVTFMGADGERLLKARELAGASDLLFLRNGHTGRVEVRPNGNAITLNEALHAHN
ncbi:MAG: DapH/DapD/GlmU-related protein [Pseudomonadota bacterium]